MSHTQLEANHSPSHSTTADTDKNETVEKKEDSNYLHLLKSFVDNSDSKVFSQLYNARDRRKRWLWTFICLVSMAMLAVHVALVIRHFLRFETQTNFASTLAGRLPFPAVTVCNQNRHRHSAPATQTSDIINMESTAWTPEKGHQANDMFVYSTFAKTPISHNEEYFNMGLGNCYVFNWGGGLNSTGPGPDFGMELLLNVEEYEYENRYPKKNIGDIPPLGAVVTLHGAHEMSFPKQKGVAVAPGTSISISMTQTRYDRLSHPYGECVEDGDDVLDGFLSTLPGVRYSQNDCTLRCTQLQIVEQCGCYEVNLPLPIEADSGAIKPCNNSVETEQGQCVLEVSKMYFQGEITCEECKASCHETQFAKRSSSAPWPGRVYEEDLIKILKRDREGLIEKLISVYGNGSMADAISHNLVRVQIFYDELLFTQITENPAYELSAFIADIGAVFGLWIGWNLFTALQLMELLTDFTSMVIKSRKRKSQKADAAPPSEILLAQSGDGQGSQL